MAYVSQVLMMVRQFDVNMASKQSNDSEHKYSIELTT